VTTDEKIQAALSDEDQTYRGFPVSELRRAFNIVADQQDWKAPINAPIFKGSDLKLFEAAVVFFTGTMPNFRTVDGVTWCRALGYRMGPAGP